MSHRNRNVPAPAEPTFLEKFERTFIDYRPEQIPEMAEKLYYRLADLYTDNRQVPTNIFEVGRFAWNEFGMRSSFVIACMKWIEGHYGKELEDMGYIFQKRKP